MHHPSALVKLVPTEEWSDAMRPWVGVVEEHVVNSDFTRTKLMRAVSRVHRERAPRLRAELESVQIVGLTRSRAR